MNYRPKRHMAEFLDSIYEGTSDLLVRPESVIQPNVLKSKRRQKTIQQSVDRLELLSESMFRCQHYLAGEHIGPSL